MKRILAITFLNNFVSGGLALIIPLLLLKRNVSLAEIGVVISILPLIFLVVRLVFAALADQVGWARFYLLLNWPGTLISTLIYFLADSLPVFLVGKITEAVKTSSYWAVNRTAIFTLSPREKAVWATRNAAVLSLASSTGSAISGIALTFLGFSPTLILLILVSGILVIPAALIWQAQGSKAKVRFSGTITLLNPKGKGRTFWIISVIMLFFSLAFYPLFALLLPVFMAQQLGYSYMAIGIVFMLYGLIAASVTFSTLKIPLGLRRVVIQSSIALSVTFLLAYSGSFFIILLLALAIADGLGIRFFESIIAKASRNELTVSVDIGLLHVPMRIAEFTSVLSAGFIAESFGYMPVFAASGVFFTLFSVLSMYALRM
ncbi:MAG: MFS transporter [Candidatus Bathyarchaeota archaeon]|nr:MAG: MFS transporter [Candidatus Bathyarchaeota archaeon]